MNPVFDGGLIQSADSFTPHAHDDDDDDEDKDAATGGNIELVLQMLQFMCEGAVVKLTSTSIYRNALELNASNGDNSRLVPSPSHHHHHHHLITT